MARITMFKNQATGLIEQIVVSEADAQTAEQIKAWVDGACQKFGASVVLFPTEHSVEFV